jgi:acyl carrier protein
MSAAAATRELAYPALAGIFTDVFGYTGPLTEETTPEQVTRWDSLQHIALVRVLESTYDIQLSLDEMMEMRCVGDIERVLARHGV